MASPILYQNRYAKVTTVYDGSGRFVEATLWDLNGKRLPPARVTVVTVKPGSQAAQLGLQAGDIMVSYAGQAVSSARTFNARVNAWREGRRDLWIMPGAEMLTFQVAPGDIGLHLEDRELVASQEP
jgi:PDZ domain